MSLRFVFISGGQGCPSNSLNKVPQILNDVERYDPMRDIWESLPTLNLSRYLHSSCILGKTLYVLGGING